MVTVINKKDSKNYDGVKINIMRPTTFSNPYKIGKDGNREEVIAKYRRYLWQKIKAKDSKIIAGLNKLSELALAQDLYLVCCCKPLACHGDILKSCIEWYTTRNWVESKKGEK